MQTDMTVGKPMKMILDFTIPVFIGNVFQQFYNMADAPKIRSRNGSAARATACRSPSFEWNYRI